MKALLTSRAEIEIFGKTCEKDDIIPVEFNQENSSVSFSLRKTEFIKRLVEKSKVFAVNMPVFLFEKESDICERHEGEFEDKFWLAGLQKTECSAIDCPAIKRAVVYECDFVKEADDKDKVIVFGRVLTTREA